MKIVILLFMLCPLIFANEKFGKIAIGKIKNESNTAIDENTLESITALFEEALGNKNYNLLTRNEETQESLRKEQDARKNDISGLDKRIADAKRMKGDSVFIGEIYKHNNKMYIKIQIIGIDNEIHASETFPVNAIREIDKSLVASIVQSLDDQINKEQIDKVAEQKRLDAIAEQKRLDEQKKLAPLKKRTGYHNAVPISSITGIFFATYGGIFLVSGITLLSISLDLAVGYGDNFIPFDDPKPIYDSFGVQIGRWGSGYEIEEFNAFFWSGIGLTSAGIILLILLIEYPYTYYAYEPVEDLSFTPYIFPDIEGDMHYGINFSYTF